MRQLVLISNKEIREALMSSQELLHVNSQLGQVSAFPGLERIPF